MNVNFTMPHIEALNDEISVPGYTHPHWWEFTTSRYEGDAFAAAVERSRKRDGAKTSKILAATDLRFYEKTYKEDGTTPVENGLTETLDTTSYPDRAILTSLKNELGYNVYLRVMWIKGKRIMQHSGKYGELLHDGLKMDDDIRRNGEKKIKISNAAIVDGATQMPKIADYHFKRCQNRKHVYMINFAGVRWHYSLGEWYNFQLGAPDTNEYIDAVVECYSVEIERDAKGIGRTVASFREVEENWTKTTLYTTRAIFGGSSRRKANVANRVIVASSSFSGEFDYSCDGTADDVQIQLALDYVSKTFGGGIVELTEGNYTIATTINIPSNIRIIGRGANTVLYPASTSVTTIISFGSNINSSAECFTINGNSASLTFTINSMEIITLGINRLDSILITNYTFANTSGVKVFYIIGGYGNAINTAISSINITNSGSAASVSCFLHTYNCINCAVSSINGSGVNSSIRAFHQCGNITSSTVNNITLSGNQAVLDGYNTCSSISSSSMNNNTCSGSSAQLTGFSGSTNISSCIVTGNICNGTSAIFNGFSGSSLITGCSSIANIGTTEVGFYQCKSMAENKSDDTTKYSSSYADSGTANACADTSAGGYNS